MTPGTWPQPEQPDHTNPPPHPTQGVRQRTSRPDPSGPNSVFAPPPGGTTRLSTTTPGPGPRKDPPRTARTHHRRHHPTRGDSSSMFHPEATSDTTLGCTTRPHTPPTPNRDRECTMLLRKEVIQPHLPVRLPCYDLVPITSPTFDSSLHKGWATGFGCYRLS